jgi:cell division protein FtsW
MIYSASEYSALILYNDKFVFVRKQVIAFVAGIIVMFLATKIKLEVLKKFRWILYFIAIALLSILLVPGVGRSVYGATRRIDLGFLSFQPSEFAKFALVILLASTISKTNVRNLINIIALAFPGIIMCILVMLEPNMSITVCIALTMSIMLFIGGIRPRHALLFAGIGLSAIPILIVTEPYRLKRLIAFINPWNSAKGEGYQLIQSYYAIASGGLLGRGLFKGMQKHLYLPFAESDFIFSIIAEELGLIGCICVIIVFLVFIGSGILIAIKTKNIFNRLLATGITSLTAVQTLVNIAVVTGTIPPTGLPLPFVSAGGSSLIMFMFATGLLINIESHNKNDYY